MTTQKLRNLWIASGVIVAAMLLISGYLWGQIPAGEEVCVHWNAAGVCDDYGSKFMGIFLLPLVTIGVAILFGVIRKIDPRSANLDQSHKAFGAVWLGTMVFMLVIHIFVMLQLLNSNVNFGVFIPAVVGALFVIIGNYMGKVRSNFFFGIRTPWTLSSEVAWNKTHRLGGRLMVLLGLAMIAGTIVFSNPAWVYYIVVGGSLGLVAFTYAYSYWVWKNDADRATA